MAKGLEVLDELVVRGKDVFISKDVEELFGLTPQAASNLLGNLVGRGLLDRVTRGHFAVRPIGALGTSAASEDITLAVASAFASQPHRIAYRSALDYHGLLDHPSRTIFVALTRRAALARISGRELKTTTEGAARIYLGSEPAPHQTRVSSVERALLESAARPRLAGGLSALVNAVRSAEANAQTLAQLGQQLGMQSAIQRLGALAEATGHQQWADDLWQYARPISVISINPSDRNAGPVDRRWRVRWNVPVTDIEGIANQ